MDKRERKRIALQIAARIIDSEIAQPSEILSLYLDDDSEQTRIYAELEAILKQLDARAKRLAKQSTAK